MPKVKRLPVDSTLISDFSETPATLSTTRADEHRGWCPSVGPEKPDQRGGYHGEGEETIEEGLRQAQKTRTLYRREDAGDGATVLGQRRACG